MKIGHFVPMIACKPGFERNVSGHVQAPLRAAGLLADAGHEVHLITTRAGADRPAMPACLPENVHLHFVTDAKRRRRVQGGVGGHARGVHVLRLKRLTAEVRDIVREHQLRLVHFHGYNSTACLAGGVRLAGLRRPTIASVLGLQPRSTLRRTFEVSLLRRVSALTAATEYGASQVRDVGLDVSVLRWGPIRELQAELNGIAPSRRSRVLYWRDPSHENGADIVRDAFAALAPEFPDLSFDLAVRPHWKEIEGLDTLAAAHENVQLYRFPYPEGVSLAKLVFEALVVLMPFREMSIDPQLVVLESMAAGAPVLGVDQRSNPEVIRPGRNGALAPVDDLGATIEVLRELLQDRERLLEYGRQAEADIRSDWNWDKYAEQAMELYEDVLTAD